MMHIPNDVLEQIRLLSNLETTRHKLLQIILIGRPELSDRLASRELRQIGQRVSVNWQQPKQPRLASGGADASAAHVVGPGW